MTRRKKNPWDIVGGAVGGAGDAAANAGGGGHGGGGGGGGGIAGTGSSFANDVSQGAASAYGGSPSSYGYTPSSSPPPAPTPTFYNPADSHTTVDLKPLIASISDPAVRSLAPSAIRAGLRYEVNPSLLLAAAKVTDYGRNGQGKGYTNLGDGSETGAKSIQQAAKYLAAVGFYDNPRGAVKKLAAQTGANPRDIRKTAAGYTELDNAVRKVQAVPGETQARGVGRLPHKEARAVAQGIATAGVVASRAGAGYESDRARAVAEGVPLREGNSRLSKAEQRAVFETGGWVGAAGDVATRASASPVARAAAQAASMIAAKGIVHPVLGKVAPPGAAERRQAALEGPRPRRVARRLEKAAAKVSASVPDYVPSQYRNLIADASRKYGVPAGLLSALLRQESGFNPTIGSSAGAQGIAQFMPGTASGMGVDPLNPKSAIPGAARLLAGNKDQFGSWELALAAYNAGGGAVSEYGGIPPYPETQNYVKTIMDAAGDTGGTASSAPRRLVQRGYDVLGREATKAILNGGKLVKAPKGGVKETRFTGRYAGSQSVVRYLVGTKVKGDHGGTKNGEAPGVHTPDGDHYRADGYAQDINGTSPGENEPAYDQSTLDTIVKNLRRAGANPPPGDIQIGENWEGTVGRYSVQLLTNEDGVVNHIHVGAHPTDGDGGGTAPPALIPIKGTNLAVRPPAPVLSATGTALTGSTTTGGVAALGAAIDAASNGGGSVPVSTGGVIPRSSAGNYARSSLSGATTQTGGSPLDRFRSDPASTGDPILDAFRPRRRRS